MCVLFLKRTLRDKVKSNTFVDLKLKTSEDRLQTNIYNLLSFYGNKLIV